MEPVRLEEPLPEHEAEFLEAVGRSRELHHPWVAPPSTPAAFSDYVAKTRAGRDLGFLLRASSGELAGVVNVNEIVRGCFLSAYLGYYAFVPCAGKGLMKRGMAAVITRVFREHGLHRLEANVQPENTASIALVRSLGFEREGFSPRYLRIDGRWRDHERWALLAEQWEPHRSAAAPPHDTEE